MVDRKKASDSTEFGSAVSEQLTASGSTYSALATSTNTNPTILSKRLTGTLPLNKQWVDLVVNAMKVQPEEQDKLYRAAATDILRAKGFDLDLTKKE